MIYLPRLLSSGLIRVRVSPRDKRSLIEEMSTLLALAMPVAHGAPLDKDTIFEAVWAQEQRRPSALGQGGAVPHARIEGLAAPAACLATLSHGLDFDAADDEPVTIVCLLLAPLEDPSTTLKILAEVATLLSDPVQRAAVESAEDPVTVHDLFRKFHTGEERSLRARNIMRRPLYRIYPETPLTEVTRLLAQHGLEATSVVDHEGHVVGLVTCDLLFRFGLPEFFGQLKSVAFIKNFDPFENYFKTLKTATAGAVMSDDFATVQEDATLLEVVFELSVHRRPKVFVVRNGVLCGIIDRIALLNRVINY